MYKNSAWDYHKLDNNCPFNMTLFVVTFKIAHMFGKFNLVGISLLKSLTWLQYLSLKGVSDKPRSTLLSSSTLFDVCLVDDIWCEHLFCNGHKLLFQQLQPKLVFGGLRMEQFRALTRKLQLGLSGPNWKSKCSEPYTC